MLGFLKELRETDSFSWVSDTFTYNFVVLGEMLE